MNIAFTLVPSLIAVVALAAEPQKMPLKVEPGQFVLWDPPVTVKAPNLEEPNTPRPKILVPTGTVNVAKGKKVTSSNPEPIVGELAQITDGDKQTEGSYVELEPGLQWVQIDLGAKHVIYAVAVWHYYARDIAYHDVIVQTCDTAAFTNGVTVVYNNDHDNSTKLGKGTDKGYIETFQGKLIDAKGVTGRYVRLYSRGSTVNELNRYTEVEVYGTPETKK